MNIFVFDREPAICAQHHSDSHVVKMILETAQLLSSAHWMTGGTAPYKLTHKNHPCSVWTRECIENYNWLLSLGFELCKEYTLRYNRVHKSQEVLEVLSQTVPNITRYGEMTEFPKVVSENCVQNTVIESYRTYFCKEKKHLAEWTNRYIPFWYNYPFNLN